MRSTTLINVYSLSDFCLIGYAVWKMVTFVSLAGCWLSSCTPHEIMFGQDSCRDWARKTAMTKFRHLTDWFLCENKNERRVRAEWKVVSWLGLYHLGCRLLLHVCWRQSMIGLAGVILSFTVSNDGRRTSRLETNVRELLLSLPNTDQSFQGASEYELMPERTHVRLYRRLHYGINCLNQESTIR